MTGIPLSRAFWIGLLKATGSTTETSMPYCVGTKNGLVVTWLTKTKFHSGVFGKLPPDPPDPPWLACCAASRRHPSSNNAADASALPARNCLRPSLYSPSPFAPDPRSLIYHPCLWLSNNPYPAGIVIPICIRVKRIPRVLLCALVPPEAHPGCSTAVYVEDLSCNEVGSVGDEEGYCGCDVTRMAHAAPGDQSIAELGRIVWDVEVAGDFYDPGADGVDADPAVGELYG